MKKNKTEVTNKMVFDYLHAFLLRKSIFFFTRFYPFSLLLQDSIYHYRNRYAKEFEDILLKTMRKLKFKTPLYYVDLPGNPPLITYYLSFYKDRYKYVIKNREIFLKSIAKDFNINVNNLYFNEAEEKKTWKLQFPYEYFYKS